MGRKLERKENFPGLKARDKRREREQKHKKSEMKERFRKRNN